MNVMLSGAKHLAQHPARFLAALGMTMFNFSCSPQQSRRVPLAACCQCSRRTRHGRTNCP